MVLATLVRPAPSAPAAPQPPEVSWPAGAPRPGTAGKPASDVVWRADTTAGPPGDFWYLMLPASISLPDVPSGMECPDLYYWMRELGAVESFGSLHSLELKANVDVRFQLISLRARIVRRVAAQHEGSEVSCKPPGGRDPGFPHDPAQVLLRLGDPGTETATKDKLGYPFWKRDLRAGEQEVMLIGVGAPEGYFDVYYALDVVYEIGGRRRTQTLDDHGTPFVLRYFRHGMDYVLPQLKFTREPRPHFAYTPARCNPSPCP
jgi:hypothetical protein